MGKIYDGSNFFMKLKMHGYFVLSCRRILIGRHRCERSGRLGGLQHHPGHRRLCPRRPGALHAQLVLRLPVSTHAGISADRVSDPHLLLCGSGSGWPFFRRIRIRNTGSRRKEMSLIVSFIAESF